MAARTSTPRGSGTPTTLRCLGACQPCSGRPACTDRPLAGSRRGRGRRRRRCGHAFRRPRSPCRGRVRRDLLRQGRLGRCCAPARSAQWLDGADDQILDGDLSGLTDEASFASHPPMGKWVIAAGEWVAGLTPLGWRLGVAVLGTLAAVVMVYLARRVTRSTALGGLAGLLVALDGLAIVTSRIAVLDGMLMFWVVLAAALLVRDRDSARAGWRPGWAARADAAVGPGASRGRRSRRDDRGSRGPRRRPHDRGGHGSPSHRDHRRLDPAVEAVAAADGRGPGPGHSHQVERAARAGGVRSCSRSSGRQGRWPRPAVATRFDARC